MKNITTLQKLNHLGELQHVLVELFVTHFQDVLMFTNQCVLLEQVIQEKHWQKQRQVNYHKEKFVKKLLMVFQVMVIKSG